MDGQTKTLVGMIQTTQSGLGFIPSPDFKEDIRIEQGYLNTALNGDTVEVCFHAHKKGRQPSGEVVRVLRRKKTRFVGVLEQENGSYFLVPDDRKIYTDILVPNPPKNIPKEYKVLVELTSWDDPARNPTGKILETLGRPGDHDVEMRAITLDKNIDTTFPAEVKQEAQQIQSAWNKDAISRAMTQDRRKDLRSLPTFTIDPHDAKDFDDALSLREIPNDKFQAPNKNQAPNSKTQNQKLWEVGIHIADVSHFVQPNSALDEEAEHRGFSTYLVDRTIPMLPEALSNDLCSLNPETDRFAFSAVFTLDTNAHIQKRWFGKSVIHSNKRFTYEEAQTILDTRQGQFQQELHILHELAQKIRSRRIKQGAIDFDTDEVEVEMDSQNTPVRIYKKEMLATNKLIEDFMLMANQEVAHYIFKAHKKSDTPKGFVYRVHDVPDPEKLEQVGSLLEALGYPTFHPKGRSRKHKSAVSPRDINRVIEAVEGSAVETMIKTAILRSMSKAAYTTKNIGHFGLGFSYYTHFTSPIRRYPDLLVHRLLMKHLNGHEISDKETREHAKLAWELSQKEITIQEAERESVKYKQVEYMQSRIGVRISGVITGVTEWGFYVADKETGAEGLVRVASITDDYYIFEEKKYRLVGKKKKKKYTLGDTVQVRVTGTNLEQKTIDFEVV